MKMAYGKSKSMEKKCDSSKVRISNGNKNAFDPSKGRDDSLVFLKSWVQTLGTFSLCLAGIVRGFLSFLFFAYRRLAFGTKPHFAGGI